jgi:hypothetical protein
MARLDPRERYDWVTGRWYVLPARVPLPRVQLITHRHVCPDGTAVTVKAQWISPVQATLYRWSIAGERAGCTSSLSLPETPPDWSGVDDLHPQPILDVSGSTGACRVAR